MNENTNLTYNDFSAGQVTGGSLCAEGNIYLDLR